MFLKIIYYTFEFQCFKFEWKPNGLKMAANLHQDPSSVDVVLHNMRTVLIFSFMQHKHFRSSCKSPSQDGASTWLGVLSLTWKSYPEGLISLCDVTKRWFSLLHNSWCTWKHGRSSKGLSVFLIAVCCQRRDTNYCWDSGIMWLRCFVTLFRCVRREQQNQIQQKQSTVQHFRIWSHTCRSAVPLHENRGRSVAQTFFFHPMSQRYTCCPARYFTPIF